MTGTGIKAVAGLGNRRACAPLADNAEGCPPRLIGGEQNKTPNPQGADQTKNQAVEFQYFSHFVSDGKGRLIEIPLRRGRDDGAFIDQITFTIHEDSLPKVTGKGLVSDTEYIVQYSELLQEILGFGITQKLPFKGKFFYKSCYQLGPDNVEYGKVHYGGQRDTILVELNGTGCMAALPGWENRLYEFLSKCIRPKITRVDVAHDFFNGEYTPDQAMLDHDNGHYDVHNMRPKSECRGTAWRNEDGSGKTFYIGKRGNSKFTRVYEKGRQFGDVDSPWVRFETEFRAGDIEIPLDMLLYSGSYLGGAYPICKVIFKTESKRMNAKEETVNLTFEHKLFYARNQVGKLVSFLRGIGWEDGKIVDELLKGVEGYPKGLQPEQYDCRDQTQRIQYIHEEQQAIEALKLETLLDDWGEEKQTAFPQDTELQHIRDIEIEERQISNFMNRN
ncbi:replication initiation factor family protein [Neisseria brasiliensis]|uniref:Replication initiation factor family protein n=1 Tax=Neisseria brasiliensis TaxID=2666100 RepID=A0A7X2GXY4_9NEIS|nr:replication initiation factor domain-containing protein [Neisseria brasiliensis]MRN38046.1 replication initiation factor family protein [Neisseria brasiliensis]